MGIKKNAQVSVEYLSLLGFVIVAISILVVLSVFYARDATDTVLMNQVDRLAKEIIDNAEKVYYWGPPTRITINAEIPKGVDTIEIDQNTLIFTVRSQHGRSEIAYLAKVNITGAIDTAEGIRQIKVEAQQDAVVINGTLG